MKNKLWTSDSELIDRDSNHQNSREELYSDKDFKEHTSEMVKQRIISDGENWINRQKSQLKLTEEKFEFTADNVRREIEKYLWELKSDENMKQDIINNINIANDRLDYPWIYQAAALLLNDLKEWGPYSSLPWKDNSGVWVKALLGKRHFECFIEEKKNCIGELEAVSTKWERRPLEDMLASCELDYIYHNVLWANGHFRYFGNREGSNNQDWITNPSNIILSENFADKLRWLYQSWVVHRSAKIN